MQLKSDISILKIVIWFWKFIFQFWKLLLEFKKLKLLFQYKTWYLNFENIYFNLKFDIWDLKIIIWIWKLIYQFWEFSVELKNLYYSNNSFKWLHSYWFSQLAIFITCCGSKMNIQNVCFDVNINFLWWCLLATSTSYPPKCSIYNCAKRFPTSKFDYLHFSNPTNI